VSLRRLAVGHGCVDVYQGAVAALVPWFVAERAWTYAAVSGLVLAASLLSTVTQPLFGMLTDRFVMPWLLPVSTVVSGAGVVAGAVTGWYPLTLACMAVAGTGVAAYHPEAARQARAASRGSHRGMAWFSLGGNVGFACAPLLVAVDSLPVLAVPALAGAVLCLRAPAARPAGRGSAETGADDGRSFAALTLVIICRSVVFTGLSTFLALYAQQRGANGTVALFLLYLGGAAGTVAGGRLAERWGRVAVIRWSYLLTVAAVAGVVLVPGPAFPLFVALTSAGLYVPFSLQITLAQDYLPTRAGTASGVTLGLTVTAGGLAAPVLGVLADAAGLRTALLPLIVFPFLAWLVARGLPEPRMG
jgi:FSR family fosmidomycin resistance protein-like MFS transporter